MRDENALPNCKDGEAQDENGQALFQNAEARDENGQLLFENRHHLFQRAADLLEKVCLLSILALPVAQYSFLLPQNAELRNRFYEVVFQEMRRFTSFATGSLKNLR